MSGRRRMALLAAGAVIAAAGVGTGLALAGPARTSGTTETVTADTAALAGDAHSAPVWMTSAGGYSTMMSRYGTGANTGSRTMGGGMMGGTMMRGSEMGGVMGRVLDGLPGPRVGTSEAEAYAHAVPAGAVVDRAHNRITFTSRTVSVSIVAVADVRASDRFEVAGMFDPELVVPHGAQVTLRLVNSDPDAAHGIVVSTPDTAKVWMPMMSGSAAFPGAAIWALGEADSRGAAMATTSFTVSTAGDFTYLCPVPDHALQGMFGRLTVVG